MSLEATPCRHSAQLQVKARGAYTHHVTKCIDKIELLQNIESLRLVLSGETNLLQDFYGGDGRWAGATKCMRDNTKERTSDICPKGRSGDPRVVTRGQFLARSPEIGETTNSDVVRPADDLGEFFQGGEPGQDC